MSSEGATPVDVNREVFWMVDSAIEDVVFKVCDWGAKRGISRDELDHALVRACEGLEDAIGVSLEEYFA